MKKLNYMLLCLVTLYLAGMYRYLPLMLMAVLEIAFMAVSFIMSHYFCRNLSVKALRSSDSVQKAHPLLCGFRVQNEGKLPINRFRIRLLSGYGAKLGREKKYVYGGSECGEDILKFEIVGQYCGILHLNMNQLQVYDYLSLFSASKKSEEEVKIAVFPQERALSIELPSLCYQDSELRKELRPDCGADIHNEIRQLREYHMEDSRRYIHWNQSARMEQLVVKEFEKEADTGVSLGLDLQGIWKAKASEMDDFYELFSALIMGLLKKTAFIRVYWYHGERKCQAEVANAGQCRDVLLALYQAKEEICEEAELVCTLLEGCFTLDLNLGWYWNETLIFRFSREMLYDQIAYKTFVI